MMLWRKIICTQAKLEVVESLVGPTEQATSSIVTTSISVIQRFMNMLRKEQSQGYLCVA